MIDICYYYGQTPPEVVGNDSLNDLLVNFKPMVVTVDGLLNGEVDFFYCEFCQHSECLYHSFVNLN